MGHEVKFFLLHNFMGLQKTDIKIDLLKNSFVILILLEAGLQSQFIFVFSWPILLRTEAFLFEFFSWPFLW